MKKILLFILSLSCFQIFLSQENLIENTNDLSNYEILSKYEKESDAEALNRRARNEVAPDLLETSGVNENLPKSSKYLSKEDSAEGLLDLNKLSKQGKIDNNKDMFFEILTLVIASIILFLIGRLVLKK